MPKRQIHEPQVVDVLAESAESAETPDDTPQVADPPPAPAQHRPVPESQLTPEQRRIRELEDQLAKERGRKDPDPELVEPASPGADGNIRIHFLEDGFTALGQVWYRGQEIEFEPGGRAYADTCDKFGRSWLEMRADEFAQVERFGKVMFREGPWPGKGYLDAAKAGFENLKVLSGDGTVQRPSETELLAAATAETKRRRAAPRLPALH